MKNLTPTMMKVLAKIIDYIDFAKKYDNFHDYYMARSLRYMEGRNDYDELVSLYEDRYDRLIKDKYFDTIYLRSWKNARENDISLTSGVSSSTLRALETRGYIAIIEDGREGVDEVKLLKRI